MQGRVLVVEDDESLVTLLTHALAREGYETGVARDGEQAWARITSEEWDVVILDLMLPRRDGLEICRQMRAEHNYTPIIMLTARDDEIDRVVGLEMGADDYVTKPFSVRELMARVKAMMRRRRNLIHQESEREIELGELLIKPDSYEVYVRGERVELTRKEFELLCVLVQNRGRVLKRDYLLQTLWDYSEPSQTRVLDVHISNLREKLKSFGLKGGGIETVRGIGYKFEEKGYEK